MFFIVFYSSDFDMTHSQTPEDIHLGHGLSIKQVSDRCGENCCGARLIILILFQCSMINIPGVLHDVFSSSFLSMSLVTILC
jgi:hypothetical protein